MKLFALGRIKKGSIIKLIARAESDDGMIGDTIFDVEPGNNLLGFTYDEVFKQLDTFGFLSINETN